MKYIINDIFILFPPKWWLSAKHNKHNYTHWPYITLSRITSFEHFGSYIIWCTIWFVHYFIWIYSLSQTKVDQFKKIAGVLADPLAKVYKKIDSKGVQNAIKGVEMATSIIPVDKVLNPILDPVLNAIGKAIGVSWLKTGFFDEYINIVAALEAEINKFSPYTAFPTNQIVSGFNSQPSVISACNIKAAE